MRAPQPEQWSMSVRKDDMQKSSSWKALGVDGGEKRSSRDGAAAPSVVQFPMRGVPKLDSRVGRQIAAHIHAEKLAHLEDLPRRAGVETNVFCLACVCLALSLFRRRTPRLCRGEPRLWRGKPAARCKPVRFSACHMKPLKSPHFFHCPRILHFPQPEQKHSFGLRGSSCPEGRQALSPFGRRTRSID